HGWPRPCAGQCVRRAAVANGQIRRRLSQGLLRSARRAAQSEVVLQFLQWRTPPSGTRLSNPESRLPVCSEQNKDAASRRFRLMSFEGMRKSIRTMEAPPNHADAPAHLSDEFPAGYSLTRCSPAELVSASPAGDDNALARLQVRGLFDN